LYPTFRRNVSPPSSGSKNSSANQRASTTRRHIPEEDTLQNHRCENLKSYKKIIVAKSKEVKTGYNLAEPSKEDFAQKGLFCQ
jgi:hypothetical protein